MSGKANINRK